MDIRIIQITEDEARAIRSHFDGPRRANLQPTDLEIGIIDKMEIVLASFAAERTLTMEELDIIRQHRARAVDREHDCDDEDYQRCHHVGALPDIARRTADQGKG